MPTNYEKAHADYKRLDKQVNEIGKQIERLTKQRDAVMAARTDASWRMIRSMQDDEDLENETDAETPAP